LWQNFAPGSRATPQFGQVAAGVSEYPQFKQNRAFSGLAVWQLGQITGRPPSGKIRSASFSGILQE
jgi:hypothetical protein